MRSPKRAPKELDLGTPQNRHKHQVDIMAGGTQDLVLIR
jgi:hypothetical protein